MKNLKVHLVVIDPQNDFMDGYAKAALPVAGGTADMQRLAVFVNTHGHRIASIHATFDSHQIVDIAHPIWWINEKGENPPPYTVITADDIEAGIWKPFNPKYKQRNLDYARTLEATKKYALNIWPPHCRIGTEGHAIQPDLMEALEKWQTERKAMVDYVTKGSNPFTEHYGALMAEVPDPTDPSTQLNSSLLNTLAEADIILIAGEALSHCVKETLNQIVDNIGDEHVKKIQILTDCTSSIGAIPGVDFPAITAQWLKDIQKRGVQVTTTTTFFN